MTTKTILKEQIYSIIESLSVEHLIKLLQFLKELLPADSQPATIAPIYQLHHQAIDTGIPDLAENHDHYLYGVAKQNE